jgi:cation diffusion facilitator family transporter
MQPAVRSCVPTPNAPNKWMRFGKQLYREIQDDQVSNGAAALAFYMMLAVFPAAIFGLSLLPYLSIPQLHQAIFELLYQLLPNSAAALFTDTVEHIVSDRHTGLLSFGLMFAIWSASSGLYAIMQQLNVVYSAREARPYWKTRAVAMVLMLLFFVLLVATFALVIFGGFLQDWIADKLGWSTWLRTAFALFRWLVIAFALLAAFALVYRLAPNVQRRFQLFSAGNIFATLGLLLVSFGFRLYVGSFGSYDKTYGGLGAVIVLLMWMFIMGWVILIGGEINDLMEREARAARPKRSTRERSHMAIRARLRQLAQTSRSTYALRLAWHRREHYAAAETRDPAERPDSSFVVWVALAANVAIAVAKYIAASITGSSALLSEAFHSTADTSNELLLLLGGKLSQKPADSVHPFGRGQESYFWGLIVALLLFGMGGGLSFYEGVQHVVHPRAIENPGWNYLVLGCSFVFESVSFAVASSQMRKLGARHHKTLLAEAHDSKDPAQFVVLFEDTAALLGIAVAFAGVYASQALSLPVLDGVASLVIGLILATAAVFLAYECRSLLLGESADPEKVQDIRALAASDPAVRRVGAARTMYLGPNELLLDLEVDFKNDLNTSEIEAAVQRLERAIRMQQREVRRIFIEVTSLEHGLA